LSVHRRTIAGQNADFDVLTDMVTVATDPRIAKPQSTGTYRKIDEYTARFCNICGSHYTFIWGG
jgi:hypothetical protein